MKYYLRYFIVFMLLNAFVFAGEATQLTKNSEISVLTCSPGRELYSGFGHSAIRLTNKQAGVDYIFNFGTFNFNDPDFYLKFLKGKLVYFLSISNYEAFETEYKYSQRGVHEQVLELSLEEKQQIFERLLSIFNSEERYYKYDFLDNNCTTKIYEILKEVLGDKIILHHNANKKTYRELLHPYLENKKWAKLGIDILLGLPTDKKPNKEQYLFLPDYLESGLDKATIDDKPFVKEKRILLEAAKHDEKTMNAPLIFFTGLLVLIIILQFMRLKIILKLIDFFYFPVITILFFLLLFMWFFTDHDTTPCNLDLLWTGTLPFFGIWKRKTKKYGGKITGILIFLLLIMVIAAILGYLSFVVVPIFMIGLIRILSSKKQ